MPNLCFQYSHVRLLHLIGMTQVEVELLATVAYC